jgi:PKD repeat protein
MPEVLGLTLPSDAIAAGAPAPVAFFVGAPVVGDFPLAVSFTNLSSGAEGATFLWDFGD